MNSIGKRNHLYYFSFIILNAFLLHYSADVLYCQSPLVEIDKGATTKKGEIFDLIPDSIIKTIYPNLKYEISHSFVRGKKYMVSYLKLYSTHLKIYGDGLSYEQTFKAPEAPPSIRVPGGVGPYARYASYSLKRFYEVLVEPLNEDQLKELASKSKISDLQASAIRKTNFVQDMDWQEILAKNAELSENIELVKISLEKLDANKWQELFAKKVMESENNGITKLSLEKLDANNWQELFATVVLGYFEYFENVDLYPDFELFSIAIKKLDPNNWQDIFRGIASANKKEPEYWKEEYYEFIQCAYNRILDQDFIVEMALNKKYPENIIALRALKEESKVMIIKESTNDKILRKNAKKLIRHSCYQCVMSDIIVPL